MKQVLKGLIDFSHINSERFSTPLSFIHRYDKQKKTGELKYTLDKFYVIDTQQIGKTHFSQ